MIYDHTAGKGNTSVILADSGVMSTMMDESYLVLELFNGNNYSELEHDKKTKSNERYLRSEFEKSKLIFNLSAFAFERTEKDLFKDHKLMKTMAELKAVIDSVEHKFDYQRSILASKIQKNYKYQSISSDTVIQDTLKRDVAIIPVLADVLKKSSKNVKVINRALKKARAIKSFTNSNGFRIKHILKERRRNEIEYWKKTAIPFSCIILFLIGAPLGAIIKKGGIGIPVIISISFFILLYVINEQGRKGALYSEMTSWYAMWMSNIYLFPIGLFFLYQARKDSNILEFDYWKNIPKNIFKINGGL